MMSLQISCQEVFPFSLEQIRFHELIRIHAPMDQHSRTNDGYIDLFIVASGFCSNGLRMKGDILLVLHGIHGV